MAMKKARSSITGRFVPMAEAKADPDQYVIEEHPDYMERLEMRLAHTRAVTKVAIEVHGGAIEALAQEAKRGEGDD